MQSPKNTNRPTEVERHPLQDTTDLIAMAQSAKAYRAGGNYREAIRSLERVDAFRNSDPNFRKAAPGHPGSRIEIACLHWMLDEKQEAILQMHTLAAGILEGIIQYGDAAGGMRQGLLLYYMGVSAHEPNETEYALDYLKNRLATLQKLVGKDMPAVWPAPVAHYLLDNISFEVVLQQIDRQPKLAVPDAEERLKRSRRSRLAFAIFYDAVKNRAKGNEKSCLSRMKDSYELTNASLEWFLARHELQEANAEIPAQDSSQ